MTHVNNLDFSDKTARAFGRELAKIFDRTLETSRRHVSGSSGNPHDHFAEYIATLAENDRLVFVAQSALESFVHDLMFFFESSDVFQIVGRLEDGKTVDVKDACPEGLHGQQLDWLEEFGKNENTLTRIWKVHPPLT